jgi:hypothetical protein
MKKFAVIALIANLCVLFTGTAFAAPISRSITFKIINSTNQKITTKEFWGDEGSCKIIDSLSFTCKTNAQGKIRFAIRFIVNGNFKSLNFPILWLIYPASQNQSLTMTNLRNSSVAATLSTNSWPSDDGVVTITFSNK